VKGKIALEEHFAIPETVDDLVGAFPPSHWQELRARLLDIQDRRLREMDANGVEITVLSFNAPGVQSRANKRDAIELARIANDYLAEQVALRPDRFRGFAALPLQDVDAATEELRRAVVDLGFVGALVNGFTQSEDHGDGHVPLYYDLPQFRPFWAEVERLDVPFYLHPRNPLPQDARIYDGHPWLLGPTWAFAQETAVHSLRLMGSGLFDEHPGLRIVIGHMGEGIPAMLYRIDHRNGWVDAPHSYPAQRLFADYFAENFYITTSGNFRTQSLIDAMLEIGADRIMFSTDWPFENIEDAAKWFDNASISEADRLKIGRTTALDLFKLS
jgi:2,3-dihydroxybenzoate decarboxylase